MMNRTLSSSTASHELKKNDGLVRSKWSQPKIIQTLTKNIQNMDLCMNGDLHPQHTLVCYYTKSSPLATNYKCLFHLQFCLIYLLLCMLSSVQSLSRVRLFATPWITTCQASLSITNSWSIPKPMSIESVMPSSHLILCRPLFLLPPIPPNIRVFSNDSTLRMRWPKYGSFSFSISPSNEHPGLISFRMDWLDHLAV